MSDYFGSSNNLKGLNDAQGQTLKAKQQAAGEWGAREIEFPWCVLQTLRLHPTPYTLHPTPHTLHPTPHTLHRTPSRVLRVSDMDSASIDRDYREV